MEVCVSVCLSVCVCVLEAKLENGLLIMNINRTKEAISVIAPPKATFYFTLPIRYTVKQ